MQGLKKIPGIFSVTSHSSMSWQDSARQFSLGTLGLTARNDTGSAECSLTPMVETDGSDPKTQRLES